MPTPDGVQTPRLTVLPPAIAPGRPRRTTIRDATERLGVARAWSSAWRDRLVTVVLMTAALALFVPRLDTPSRYFFDEILHAYTAGQYLRGNADAYRSDLPCSVGRSDRACAASNPAAKQGERIGKYEWTHPPLGKELIAVGIAFVGDHPFGWRIAGAVAGAIGVALAYWLGLVLTRRRGVALLTAGFLLADGLYFVESRLGVPDIFGAVFLLGALLAFAGYLTAPPRRVGRFLVAIGTLSGLALATKWNAAYAWLLIILVVLVRLGDLWRATRGARPEPVDRAGLRAHLVWAPVGLLVIPVVLYFAAHLPYFFAGYDVSDFVELQRQRFAYHQTYGGQFDYESRWWQWPLALRPAWYGATSYAGGEVANVYANGNPLLYWAFLPAMAWVGWHWWRSRRAALLVLLVGFFGQWLPWMLVARPTFVYHFLPAVPFACLAVATAVADLARGNAGWRRTLAVEYVVLVALAFAFFYPLYAFVAIGDHALELRLWLPSWR